MKALRPRRAASSDTSITAAAGQVHLSGPCLVLLSSLLRYKHYVGHVQGYQALRPEMAPERSNVLAAVLVADLAVSQTLSHSAALPFLWLMKDGLL